MDAKETRRRPGANLLAFGCGTPLFLYGAGYIYLRLSHQLINYGHFIGGPNALRGGFGFTTSELVYAPLVMLEVFVRGL
ncbi:MAG: hypothetical protein AB8H86_06895 [Polyangiales bacterium]